MRLGRPKDERKAHAFKKGFFLSFSFFFFRDKYNEQITVNELINNMKEYAGGGAYSHSKMYEELQKYFGEELIITELNGKSNVVTFTRTVSSIPHSIFYPKMSDEAQKRRNIEIAAELTKSEIKILATSRASYPRQDDTASRTANLDFEPDSLQLMLTTIFNGKDVDLIKDIFTHVMSLIIRKILLISFK